MTEQKMRNLRDAFGTFMTGVTIVTAVDPVGKPIGFTANSFTSVSLDPPLLLVCLANSSTNYDAFIAADGFAVNVLSAGQIDISNTFARPAKDRFAGISWQAGPEGSPVLEGVSAWFDCQMYQVIPAGDHVVLMGEVKGFESAPAPGLGYARGAYVTPANAAEAVRTRTDLAVSPLIVRDGQVLLVDDGLGRLSLPETTSTDQGASAALRALIAQTGVSAEPGFIYSVFEDVARQRQHICFLCQAGEGAPKAGTFVPLNVSALDDVSDPAILTLLERYVAEAAVGSFGIYYGDQTRGTVRVMAEGDI